MAVRAAQEFDAARFLLDRQGPRVVTKFKKGERIFTQGDSADAVFFIKKGQLKLRVVSVQGKDAIVGILNAGDLCGEACIAGHPLRLATAIAMSDCEIIRLEKSVFVRLLADEDFSSYFVIFLLSRSTRMEEDLTDQLFNSSERRLARTLLILSNFKADGRSWIIDPRVSQETLAEIVGTTRSRISFFMNKFRRFGYISYGSKLEVHPSLVDGVLHDRLAS
jgi:CRP/FNR family transcriptional regulator, cyclic AMP receptor protein